MATQSYPVLRAEDVPYIPVPDHIAGYELVNGELAPVMGSWRRHSWLVFEVARSIDARKSSAATQP